MSSVDLTTTYLGLTLKSPLVPSASPLSDELDNIKRMAEAGAGAVVLHSLFEEQLTLERHQFHDHLLHATDSHPEALTYFPEPDSFQLGPDDYLEHIVQAKRAVEVPIIASLNGKSAGGWTQFARQIQEAGADALELNIYSIPTDVNLPGETVEQEVLDILKAVKESVTLPVAVKLSPYFSNFAHMAKRLEHEGADALVLFNRFYQPDVDLDSLEIRPHILLSTSQAMRLPLSWIGILYGRVGLDLAATGGIHSAEDVLKMLMVGAKVTMFCSALYEQGINHFRAVERDLRQWMDEQGYQSVRQMQGSMSQQNCHNPAAFERAQYMEAVKDYKP